MAVKKKKKKGPPPSAKTEAGRKPSNANNSNGAKRRTQARGSKPTSGAKKSDRVPKAPVFLSVRPGAIPHALKQRLRWVAWKAVWRRGKWAKVPCNPKNRSKADITDPTTWVTFSVARAFATKSEMSGIGFVFSAEDPYAGIDLDDCRNPKTGKIEPWAKKIIRTIDSYTEVSPSGTGVKVFLKGKLKGVRRRLGKTEMYGSGRYFTMTGHHVDRTPKVIKSRQRELDAVYEETFPEQQNDHSVALPVFPTTPPACPDDDELIKQAGKAKNGETFDRLWSGDMTAYTSPSEADLALCSILAFWTGRDPKRIDRLFRRSGLNRKKSDRSNYLAPTISKAIKGCTESYGQSPQTSRSEVQDPTSKGADLLTAELGGYSDLRPPIDTLPDAIQRYVNEATDSLVCPPDYVAVPLLVALAFAIGRTRVIQIKSDWKESAILFATIVGNTGTTKTPAAKKGLVFLKHSPDTACVSDTTVEALAVALQNHPRGIILIRDELPAFLLSFGQYKGGQGGDEQFYCDAWNATSVRVDRKTSPPIRVPEPFLWIFGGIQPTVLSNLVTKDRIHSGFIGRFLISYPNKRDRRWSEKTISSTAIRETDRLFEELQALKTNAEGVPIIVKFSRTAKREWVRSIKLHHVEETRLDEHCSGLAEALASTWVKLEAYTARIILILHVVHQVSLKGARKDVTARTVQHAMRWIAYFKAHAIRVYTEAIAATASPSLTKEARVVKWIEKKGNSGIRPRDLVTARIADNAVGARAIADRLVDQGKAYWLEPQGRKAPRLYLVSSQ